MYLFESVPPNLRTGYDAKIYRQEWLQFQYLLLLSAKMSRRHPPTNTTCFTPLGPQSILQNSSTSPSHCQEKQASPDPRPVDEGLCCSSS